MVSRSRALKLGLAGFGAFILLAVVIIAVLVATGAFSQPTVVSTESDWGAVTQNSTAIETAVVVNNPNPVGVPGIVDIEYAAKLNDVTLATGAKRGVGFGTGNNTIELETEMENTKIPKWWVAHVNGDETSELALDATVSGPGFSRQVPARSSTIETDILGGFNSAESRTVTFRNDSFLVLHEETARWGKADDETTPIEFTSDVENVHNYPVTLDGVEYVVTMNGVTLGSGQRSTGVDIKPGERGQLDITVPLDTPKMADWWREHIKDDEQSKLRIEMYGIVEQDGERKRIPLRLFDKSLRFETDMLGENDTSVELVNDAGPQNASFEKPEIGETNQAWGEVTDATTEIKTTATMDAPQQAINDLLTVTVNQEVKINNVSVASETATVSEIEAGTNRIQTTAGMDNSKVPRWWARHLNNGEQSEVVTTPTGTIDVGFTKFDTQLRERRSTFDTNLLSGMNGERDEDITIRGRKVVTFERINSEWGDVTPQTAPIDVTATVSNKQPTNVRLKDIHYTVRMNDVVLADKTAPNSYLIPPQATEQLPIQVKLDNQRMDEWWVTHLRNGEQSRLNVTVVATADTQIGSIQQPIEALGQNRTVETDILNTSG